MARDARGAAGLWWLAAIGGLLSCASTSGWAGALPAECQAPGSHEAGSVAVETRAEEDGLPVFNLFVSESLPDEERDYQARLVYRGRCLPVQLRFRGDTSRHFPKRSYTLDFSRDAPFDEPLLAEGFTGRRKVVLVSPFNDNSYLRHRLAFTLWNRMAPDHIQVKTFSAIVYVNGRYMGLYAVVDHLNAHLLAAQGLDRDGDLFKADGDDANFSRLTYETHEPKRYLHQGFEKKAGIPESGPGAHDSIAAFTAFVADSGPERFRVERDAWMEAREYEDWWIFATLVTANDSVAKNAYHYRARGGRWRPIPWDLDASFGQNWDTRRNEPEDRTTYASRNRLFARMLEDPAIAGPLRERYRVLLQGELRAEVVLGLIDQYAREIAPAARRDEVHWRQQYLDFFRWRTRTDFTTFDEEVEYLRRWVRQRWSALESQRP
ncbi:CotH kinase family protein [Archangium gephyra]|uniref:CotH kinase family protein n=1 Tax=Archangium gephyra TaxID=48 RepID=UPI003B819AE1